MLASEHGHAAAKAVNSMQPLLLNLQRELLQCAEAGSPSGAAACGSTSTEKLLSSTAVQQLLRWHACLESLDTNTLPPPCWHDVFAYLLLTGSLRAFGFGYRQVGSRDWPVDLSCLCVADRVECQSDLQAVHVLQYDCERVVSCTDACHVNCSSGNGIPHVEDLLVISCQLTTQCKRTWCVVAQH